MRITETAGESLSGPIDGRNRVFTTSLPMNVDDVGVYFNGRLKVAELDDGYDVLGPRQVRLREAPLLGDTVQVDYGTPQSQGGQAAGIPPPLIIRRSEQPQLVISRPFTPAVSVR